MEVFDVGKQWGSHNIDENAIVAAAHEAHSMHPFIRALNTHLVDDAKWPDFLTKYKRIQRCSCKKQCFACFDKKYLYYLQLLLFMHSNYIEKRQFLIRYIERKACIQNPNKTQYNYFLFYGNGIKQQVCKAFLMNVFGISWKAIQSLQSFVQNSCGIPWDFRGKHDTRVNRLVFG